MSAWASSLPCWGNLRAGSPRWPPKPSGASSGPCCGRRAAAAGPSLCCSEGPASSWRASHPRSLTSPQAARPRLALRTSAANELETLGLSFLGTRSGRMLGTPRRSFPGARGGGMPAGRPRSCAGEAGRARPPARPLRMRRRRRGRQGSPSCSRSWAVYLGGETAWSVAQDGVGAKTLGSKPRCLRRSHPNQPQWGVPRQKRANSFCARWKSGCWSATSCRLMRWSGSQGR
mmetsp:Transcript_31061/g.92426  ORF Transcript_31061/g.92426 Transcript_31061/m.92426 type:complete len:231 (-) Transcript_31061:159-851(-)